MRRYKAHKMLMMMCLRDGAGWTPQPTTVPASSIPTAVAAAAPVDPHIISKTEI